MLEYKIHPAIGVCRIGNSPTEFFIGPERPGERVNPPGGFKDSECRIKRQAARFRIFRHDTDHPELEPVDVTETCADIAWTVYLDREGGTPDSATVRGRLGRTEFLSVGEVRTDDAGRLVVLGGPGATEGDPEGRYALSDGRVDAQFWLPGEDPVADLGHAATAGWVIVSPPRYTPYFDHIVTAYDVLYDRAAALPGFVPPLGAYSTTVTFGEHIQPILERARNLRWINAGVASAGAHADWIDPSAAVPNAWLQVAANRQHIVSRLKVPPGATAPAGLPAGTPSMPAIPDLSLTKTQYQWMAAFADPAFVVPDSFEPPPLGAITAHGLDRAALEGCCGGPLEEGYDITNLTLFVGHGTDPFRPGGSTFGVLTELAVPWYSDALVICGSYWPIAIPNQVYLPDGTTATWIRPAGTTDWRRLGFIVPQGDQFVESERCDATSSIILLTPTLDFGVVPKGPGGTNGQALLAIVFEVVSTGTAVTFAYDAAPAGPFSMAGSLPSVPGSTGGVTQTVRLWIRYVTPAAEVPPFPSHDATVTVVAGGRTFVVNLHAQSGQRVASAVALVLDRSGSMSELTGSSLTKYDELRIAASDFLDVAFDGDYIQLVRYDDHAQCIPDGDAGATDIVASATGGIVSATALSRLDSDPLGSTHDTRGVLKRLITGGAFAPNGSTSIGAGIVKARDRLAPATLPVVDTVTGARATPAMVILTDGMENTAPFVTDVAAQVDAHTYAVGLGRAENTSAPVLQSLAGNNGGYLLVTGDVATSDNAFLLEKFFLQILASVNSAEVVLDPDGTLAPGDAHVVPFDLTEVDNALEVIVITPRPSLLAVSLIAPSGRVIDATSAASMPAVRYLVGTRVVLYRVALPVEVKTGRFVQAGRWRVRLSLGTMSNASRWDEQTHVNPYGNLTRGNAGRLPYSVLVHTYSALGLRASLRQSGFEPGATLELDASLFDAKVRPVTAARLRAEVTLPDGTIDAMALAHGDQPGHYRASLVARAPGVYRCRVRAEGESAKGYRFTREQTLTGAVWYGGERTATDPPSSGGRGAGLCDVIRCLLGQKGLLESAFGAELGKRGVDVERIRTCLEHDCAPADALELDRLREAGIKSAS